MALSSTKVIETVNNHSYTIAAMTPGELIKQARTARGWSQQELGRLVRISQVAIKKIEAGKTQNSKFLPQIAAALDIPLTEIIPDLVQDPATTVIPADRLIGTDRNLPIHAAAEGGAGTIIVSTDPVDWVPRPAPLMHVPRAYGLLITGDSMFPEYRKGQTALVNPNLPVVANEVYIFYAEKEGEARASIKELRRETAAEWQVSQHNPHKEFSLSRREWQWAHRVVGKYARQ